MLGSYNFPTFGSAMRPIIAALPIFAGHTDRADHYLIVIQTVGVSMNDTPEYALIVADSLDSDVWQYAIADSTPDLAQVLKLMYMRSEITSVL